jgi:hypothetical protein
MVGIPLCIVALGVRMIGDMSVNIEQIVNN